MVRSLVGAMLADEVTVARPHAFVLEHVAYLSDRELLDRQTITRALRVLPVPDAAS